MKFPTSATRSLICFGKQIILGKFGCKFYCKCQHTTGGKTARDAALIRQKNKSFVGQTVSMCSAVAQPPPACSNRILVGLSCYHVNKHFPRYVRVSSISFVKRLIGRFSTAFRLSNTTSASLWTTVCVG